MSTWSSSLARALPAPERAPGPVERWSVRPGEVAARVGGHEVSLIRSVAEGTDWARVGAALASQPVFAAPVLDGRLPVELERVFSVVGPALVPPGWGPLAPSCSCAQWRSVCAHLGAVVAELGARADEDPFVLVRWAGGDRASLMALVAAPAERPPEEDAGEGPGEAIAAGSAAAFWSAPELPAPPGDLAGVAARVRAAAPGSVLDDLPVLGHRT